MKKTAITLIIATALLTATAAAAGAAPLFPQCPPVGNNDGCSQLIVAKRHGKFAVKVDPNAPQLGYDGAEDTLIGVQNSSGRPLRAVTLASTTLGVFGFDGDGLCNPSQWPQAPAATPPGCPGPQGFGATGYEGPNTAFSNISPNEQTGTVTFARPLRPGGSAYFGLEEVIGPGQLRAGPAGHPIVSGLRVRKHNVATFQLICTDAGGCRGRALIIVRSGRRRLTVGATAVFVVAGESHQVRVRLNARGRALLRSARHLSARLSVVLFRGGGRQTTLVGKLRF